MAAIERALRACVPCLLPTGTALALALGGSSDIVGALALARALGYRSVVLVQPGGGPVRRSDTQVRGVRCEPVEPMPPPVEAPGGSFFDNATMLAYLAAADPAVSAAYYLQQPKDVRGGFSGAEPGFSADLLCFGHQSVQCDRLSSPADDVVSLDRRQQTGLWVPAQAAEDVDRFQRE